MNQEQQINENIRSMYSAYQSGDVDLAKAHMNIAYQLIGQRDVDTINKMEEEKGLK